MVRRFTATVAMISRLFGMLAAGLVGAAILVVCEMVFMRYVLRASTVWQTEFVIYSLVAATFLGSPYVLLTKGHVNVDLLPNYLAPGPRRVLGIVASLIGITFCAALAWKGYAYFAEALHKGWTTDTVWALPLWIPTLSIPLGIGLLTLQYLADIVALIAGHDVDGEI